MGTTVGSLRHTRAQQQEVKGKGGSLHSLAPKARPSGLLLKAVLPESPDSMGPRGNHGHGPWQRHLWGWGKRFRCPLGAGWARRVAGDSQGGPLQRDGQPQRAGPCTAATWPTCLGCLLGALTGLGTAGARGREWYMRAARLRRP